MRLTFFDGLDRIVICDPDGAGASKFASAVDHALGWQIDLYEAWQVERFVRRHFQDASNLQRLHAELSSQFPHIQRMGDDEILRQVSRHLQSGQWRAYVYRPAPMAPIRMPASDTTATQTQPTARQEPVKRYPEQTSASKKPPPPSKPEPERQNEVKASQDREAARLENAASEATPLVETGCR